MSRRFAVKVLFGDHAADAKMQSRFAREAEAASRLDHPSVISVIDFGETEEGLLYLVMPFVEGPSLSAVVHREAPLAADRVVKLLRHLCQGLAHAHDRGLIHRDFKADNVIVTYHDDGERPKIVDFGIAMMLESKKGSKLTTEGMVLGTPAVMSPEQASGDVVDLRTDLFALGVVLYEMLAGVLPFEGTPLEIARQNLMSAPPRISDRVPGLEVDPQLEEISHRLMAKQAEQRFQSAHEVIQALDHAFGPLHATPAPGALTPTPTPSPISVVTGSGPLQGHGNYPGLDGAPTLRSESFQGRRGWVVILAFLAVIGLAAGAYGLGFFAPDEEEVATAEETEDVREARGGRADDPEGAGEPQELEESGGVAGAEREREGEEGEGEEAGEGEEEGEGEGKGEGEGEAERKGEREREQAREAAREMRAKRARAAAARAAAEERARRKRARQRRNAPPAESREEIAKRVRTLYSQVGRHLNVMAKARGGDAVADRLTDQYFNISKPYRTNDPNVLKRIERDLHSLRRRIRAAIRDARQR